MGQAVGAALQAGIGQAATALDQGDGVGLGRGQGLEAGLDGGVGPGLGAALPVVEQAPALSIGQPGQGLDRRLQVLGQGAQQCLQQADVALQGGGPEQAGAELDPAVQAQLVALEAESQVELGKAAAHQPFLELEAVEGLSRHGQVLQGEDDLEQRVAREVAVAGVGLDELVQRQAAVVHGADDGAANLGEELVESRPSAEIRVQHEGVDEEADLVLQLGAVPPRDRGAGEDAVLAAEPMEQDLIAGKQSREQGQATLEGKGLEPAGQRKVEAEVEGVALKVAEFRARKVGGQVQFGQGLAQLAAPVGEQLVEHGSSEVPALPVGEVAELQG